jgi:hypothetical protein
METKVDRTVSQWEARYASSVDDESPARALVAFNLSQWLLESARLRRTHEIAFAIWNHALESLRLAEGMPVQEVVQLFDAAALMLVETRALTEGATGVSRTLDDLVALHERFRDRLAVFSRHSVFPIDGPRGPVDPEELLRGRASVIHALLSGDAGEALRISERALRGFDTKARGSAVHLKARALAARCRSELGDRRTARRLLEELREECQAPDWESIRCEIGDWHARTYIGTGEERVALEEVEDLLRDSSRLGLALRWTDLMCTRAELLAASDAAEDARDCLRVALFGPRDGECARRYPGSSTFPLPSAEGYRMGFIRARRVLRSDSKDLGEAVDAVLSNTTPAPNPARSRYRGRQMPARMEGDARRVQLHEQALQAVREYEEQQKPFVLYLRKFDVTVLYRAALLGPGLLEVGFYDILPEAYNMLTIQDAKETGGYMGTGTAFDRTVPALNLADDEWENVARFLIGNATTIVSECLMLSSGVRRELEIIDNFGRNQDTLVVLPEPGSSLARLDGDPLVRRFPNAISTELLNHMTLEVIPFVARLLAR